MRDNIVVLLKDKEAIFDYMMQQYSVIEKLRYENEQLKNKLAQIKEEVEEVDFFSDEAIKHDIIAYREMHKFDNKDCYDIACAIEKIKKELEDE